MEKEKYARKKTVAIRVEPYLAEYARKKFSISPKGGGIKIPYTYDLYHCIFNSMQKPPSGVVVPCEGNLLICLPDSRMMPVRKHPETYCYLSASSMTDIEQALLPCAAEDAGGKDAFEHFRKDGQDVNRQ